MTDFPGISDGLSQLTVEFTGRVSAAYSVNRDTYAPAFSGLQALDADTEYAANPTGGLSPGAPTAADHAGVSSNTFNGGEVWFDRVHVLERSYAFGNILADITDEIHFHNAYRETTVALTIFTNNVGLGLDIPDLASLPISLAPHQSLLDASSTSTSAVPLTMDVTTEGAPRFDTTLDFTFDEGTVLHVPVTGDRIAFFPIEFEGEGLTETLLFGTDILENTKGSSQRVSYRKNPRQVFEMRVLLDGRERQEMHGLLFGWQARSFGVGIWQDSTELTVAASSGASSLTVGSTSYRDFRVGGLVAVVSDSRTYDVATISALTSTTITLDSTLAFDYSVGAAVVPVRTARMSQVISGQRWPTSVEEWTLRFQVDDNDVGDSFADVSGFSTYRSEPVFDDDNVLESETMPIEYLTKVTIHDNETGLVSQRALWDFSRRVHSKGFKANSRTALWAVRRLLYWVRGRQRAFWIPTFSEDLTPVDGLASGTATLDVDAVGYTRFVQSMGSRRDIRVVLVDGTTLDRRISSSVEVSATVERLTVDSNWASSVDLADIERIEFLERVRLDSDEVTIKYDVVGRARIFVPIRAEP